MTILCISLSGCANDDYEAISSIDRREIPIVQADAEVNSERVGDVLFLQFFQLKVLILKIQEMTP